MIVVGVPSTFTYRDDVALTCVITNNFVMDWMMIEVEVGGGSGSDMISCGCGGFGYFSSFSSLSTKKRL